MEFIAKQKALKNTYDLQRHNIKEELIKNGTKDTSGKLVKKPHNNINLYHPNILGITENHLNNPLEMDIKDLNFYSNDGFDITEHIDKDFKKLTFEKNNNVLNFDYYDLNNKDNIIIKYDYISYFFSLEYQDNLEHNYVMNNVGDNSRYKNYLFNKREEKPTSTKISRNLVDNLNLNNIYSYYNGNQRKDFFNYISDQNNILSILTATTGSGKTTEIPLFLLEFGFSKYLTNKKIIITQPRKIAAEDPTRYMAALMDMPRKIINTDITYELRKHLNVIFHAFCNYEFWELNKNKVTKDNWVSHIIKEYVNYNNIILSKIRYEYLIGEAKNIIFTHPTENIYEEIEDTYYIKLYDFYYIKENNIIRSNTNEIKILNDRVDTKYKHLHIINKKYITWIYDNKYYILKNFWDNINNNTISFIDNENKSNIQTFDINSEINFNNNYKLGYLSNNYCYYKNEINHKFHIFDFAPYVNISHEYILRGGNNDIFDGKNYNIYDINKYGYKNLDYIHGNGWKWDNYNLYFYNSKNNEYDYEILFKVGNQIKVCFIKVDLDNNTVLELYNYKEELITNGTYNKNIKEITWINGWKWASKYGAVYRYILNIGENRGFYYNNKYINMFGRLIREPVSIESKIYEKSDLLFFIKNKSLTNNLNYKINNEILDNIEEEKLNNKIILRNMVPTDTSFNNSDKEYQIVDFIKNDQIIIVSDDELPYFTYLDNRDIKGKYSIKIRSNKVYIDSNHTVKREISNNINIRLGLNNIHLPYIRIYDENKYKLRYSKILRLKHFLNPDIYIDSENNNKVIIKYYVKFINEKFSPFTGCNNFNIINIFEYNAILDTFIKVNNNEDNILRDFKIYEEEQKNKGISKEQWSVDNYINKRNMDHFLTMNMFDNNDTIIYSLNYNINKNTYNNNIIKKFIKKKKEIDKKYNYKNVFNIDKFNSINKLITTNFNSYNVHIDNIKFDNEKKKIINNLDTNSTILEIPDNNNVFLNNIETHVKEEIKRIYNIDNNSIDNEDEDELIDKIIKNKIYIRISKKKIDPLSVIATFKEKGYKDYSFFNYILIINHQGNETRSFSYKTFDINKPSSVPVNIVSAFGVKHKGIKTVVEGNYEKTYIDMVTDGTFLEIIFTNIKNNTNSFLEKYSCLLIDEAHERTIQTDYILALLRNYILKNIKHKPFKNIIMSATINSNIFQNYFKTNNLYNIKGVTYGKNIYYNEKKGGMFNVIELILKSILDNSYLKNKNVQMIPANNNIYTTKNKDILIFLATQAQLDNLESKLLNNNIFENFKILKLSSRNSIFSKNEITDKDINYWSNKDSKKYTKKIIIATNIAETSVTIKNITHVIDSGLENIVYNTNNNSTQAILPTSINSLIQRMGRVGRVETGNYFPIFDKNFLNIELYINDKDYVNNNLKIQKIPPIELDNSYDEIIKLINLNLINSPSDLLTNKFLLMSTPSYEVFSYIFKKLQDDNILIKNGNIYKINKSYLKYISLPLSYNSIMVIKTALENNEYRIHLKSIIVFILYYELITSPHAGILDKNSKYRIHPILSKDIYYNY